MRFLKIVSLLLCSTGLVSSAHAQGALPEILKPGIGHHRLDSLVGNWDVAVRFRYGGGPERTGRANATIGWTLDGRVLREEYHAESGQETLQLYGFDNQRGAYYLIKFDNFDTGVLHAEGGVSADGRTITTIGNRVDPMTGKSALVRVVLTLVDRSHFTSEWYVRTPDGKEERTVLMEHTRR
jgi:hypothetical protein